MSDDPIVAKWRRRADEYDEHARKLRAEGMVYGPEGAEDCEAAAEDYRRAADEREATIGDEAPTWAPT